MPGPPQLSRRTKLFATSGTARARAAAKAAAANGQEIIDLSAGEIWTEVPESLRESAIKAINDGINRYTDTIGIQPLREVIARQLSKESEQDWATSEIAVTAGAKQALFNTAMVLFNPGDEVIIPQPYWTTFPAQACLAGARPIHLDTTRSGYEPRLDVVKSAISEHTRAIIVNTPNNPTGAVYNRATLMGLAEIAMERKLWIILDNCYAGFIHCSHRAEHFLSIAPEVRPRTIVVNAFSKQLAITGWRLGYMAAPSPVISAVKALQSHTTSNPNVIAQHGVLGYLRAENRAFEHRLKTKLAKNRQRGWEILGNLECIRPPLAEGGFYFYLDLSPILSKQSKEPQNADDMAAQLLTSAGVASVSGTAFGDPAGLRLSYGIPPDLLERGLTRLVATLNALRHSAAPVQAAH